jgi:sugar fermentation stimulation protein A
VIPVSARLAGRLVRRYQRFFADVETADGRTLVVHCPNPGSMLGCAVPGSAVRCSESDAPRRKLRHTLEMVRVSRTWVGVHTIRANQLVREALLAGAIPELRGYPEIAPEIRIEAGSRLDFGLRGSRRRPAYVEVKSVTLAEGARARFPDAVTERGRRHLEVLMRLRAQGARSVLLFVVQRADCESVEPAADIDPAYAETLRLAHRRGVEVLALRARVSPSRIVLEGGLPVRL